MALCVGGFHCLVAERGDLSLKVFETIVVQTCSSNISAEFVLCRSDSIDGSGAAETVSALAFNRAGDTIAAYSATEGLLRVWPLTASWTQRLQRGPTVLMPSRVVQVSLSS